jgi:hypothetical protein
MKTFTHTNQNGHDLVHLVGSKDDYTVTESNGTITYTSTTWDRTYVLTGNEELNFKRVDSLGKSKFSWTEEFTPFATPSQYDIPLSEFTSVAASVSWSGSDLLINDITYLIYI